MTSTKRTDLITGCSEGGMGWAVAKESAARGWRTLATLRTPAKAGSLAQEPGVEILSLDITSSESITACVKEATTLTGGKFDCLYNNSGAQLVMPLADTTLESAKALFDVNVWGVLATTQGFLPPLMVSKGTIANAGSIRAALMQP